MAEATVKLELTADLERARARIARNANALRYDLDVGTHFKQSFHRNKVAYIGGATLFGLLLSKLPARRKKVYVERKSKEPLKEAEKAGILLGLLQFLFKLSRPWLTSLATKQVADFVRARARAEK